MEPAPAAARGPARLPRHLGVFGATMMGLGAMIGTGVFVGLGVAAGVAGPSVILAVGVAAFVALCNALSSAQLAASHPVSGGAYEYGYRYLSPAFGFSAGWMFLCAKSASAATAALGFSGYVIHAFGGADRLPAAGLAAVTTLAITALVRGGLKRTSLVNVVVVSATLAALVLFIVSALPEALSTGRLNMQPIFPGGPSATSRFLEACALMFVAYAGYGRIATLGEEVEAPRRNIPRAIIAAMAVSATIYLAVGIAAVGAVGAQPLGQASLANAAPLESVLRALGHPVLAPLVAVGAMTALLGVLLNLVLGLSRVVLAMGRRGDLPRRFGALDRTRSTPAAAVLAVGAIVIVLTLVGSVKLTWSFSAFSVLVYYAVTNLAALRLPKSERLYPRAFAWTGLCSCLFLAFGVEPQVWALGLAVLGGGLGWHFLRRRSARGLPSRPRR